MFFLRVPQGPAVGKDHVISSAACVFSWSSLHQDEVILHALFSSAGIILRVTWWGCAKHRWNLEDSQVSVWKKSATENQFFQVLCVSKKHFFLLNHRNVGVGLFTQTSLTVETNIKPHLHLFLPWMRCKYFLSFWYKTEQNKTKKQNLEFWTSFSKRICQYNFTLSIQRWDKGLLSIKTSAPSRAF